MAIARSLQEEIEKSSWIRKMFETGQTLKDRHGADHVSDFSLGSPILEPPAEVLEALRDLVEHPHPGMHKYMPNAGYPGTRDAIAQRVGASEGIPLTRDDVIMTVGAAGALNVALATILDPGDEVLVAAPYFVEYIFYVRNRGGTPVVVQTAEDFDLDIGAMERAISARTKAVILNTPNNPTGRVYSQTRMDELAALLAEAERRHNRQIFVLADTPYARITYDGVENPRLLSTHPSTLLAHSYSKELGLAGQRIGFLAISPAAPDRAQLQAGTTITNRTLGFVNAPALMQLVIERALDACVDMRGYIEARELLCDGLDEAGYEFVKPEGAFYVFPRTPVPDDVAFTKELQRENVLVVPGSGFGREGHVRIAFCVAPAAIERAMPSFRKVKERVARG